MGRWVGDGNLVEREPMQMRALRKSLNAVTAERDLLRERLIDLILVLDGQRAGWAGAFDLHAAMDAGRAVLAEVFNPHETVTRKVANGGSHGQA